MHVTRPIRINFVFFDLFKVPKTKIDAKAVIVSKKKGIANIECKLCFKKISLYP